MKLQRFVVGMIETNGYILYDEDSSEGFIIDPGDEPKTFIQYINKEHIKPVGIILTHYHYDHIGAVEDLKKQYDCPVYIHKKDVAGLADPNINHSSTGFRKPVSITPDRIVIDGDQIKATGITMEVIHTPGHTPGGMCLMVKDEGIAFTGDTLFNVDIGRMDLDGGSEDAMVNSIVNKISKWDDEITIYPGHGNSATMEYVKRKNMEYIYCMKRK